MSSRRISCLISAGPGDGGGAAFRHRRRPCTVPVERFILVFATTRVQYTRRSTRTGYGAAAIVVVVVARSNFSST